MTTADITVITMTALVIWGAYLIGRTVGRNQQQELWRDHMDKCNRYFYAVDDLDRWCGHTSPHAKLIARHIKAIGDGTGCNAGTPTGDEACTINGLREQLKRLDTARAAQKEGK